MSSRQQGYYGPNEAGMSVAAIIALACAVAGAIVLGTVACTPQPSVEDTDHSVHYTQGFAVDSTDAWEMHSQGLPTYEDVMNWHMSGFWGFGRWNEVTAQYDAHVYEQLPGGSEPWDALYGIDSANPAFRY